MTVNPTFYDTLKSNHTHLFAGGEGWCNTYVVCPECQNAAPVDARGDYRSCPNCASTCSRLVNFSRPANEDYHVLVNYVLPDTSSPEHLDLVFYQGQHTMFAKGQDFTPEELDALLQASLTEIGRLRFLTIGGLECIGDVLLESGRFKAGKTFAYHNACITESDIAAAPSLASKRNILKDYFLGCPEMLDNLTYFEAVGLPVQELKQHPAWNVHPSLAHTLQELESSESLHSYNARIHQGLAISLYQHTPLIHFVESYTGLELLVNRYPVMERLIVAGFAKIVAHWEKQLRENPTRKFKLSLYFKEGETLSDLLQLPEFIVTDLQAQNASFDTLFRLQKIHKVSPICESSYVVFKQIEPELDLKRVNRLIREKEASFNELVLYLESCRARQAIEIEEALELWDSIFKMSREANLPVKRFPVSLRHALDLMQRDYHAIRGYHKLPFIQVVKGYAADLAYTSSQTPYTCQALSDAWSVAFEHRSLHHEFNLFTPKVRNGEVLLVAIRHQDDAQTPYYTLEFDVKTRQISTVRGQGNRPVSDVKLKEFIKEFEEHLKLPLNSLKETA